MAETLAKDAPGAPGLPVIRDAVRRVLTRMFGPPPFDPDRDPGDPDSPARTPPRGASSASLPRSPAASGGC
jgi:hypothetical protein